MFKVVKDDKIIGISADNKVAGLVYDEIVEDTEHSLEDYQYNEDQYFLKSEIPAPTQEEQEEKRAQAYLIEIDPITAHIQRLRDEAEPDEEKIAELIQERNQKVQEIKDKYPYPVETEEAV